MSDIDDPELEAYLAEHMKEFDENLSRVQGEFAATRLLYSTLSLV